VLTANSPEEALRLAEEHGQGIDLLLTDVVMPVMNGPQLAAAMRARHPQVQVLFMSGYVDGVTVGPDGVDGLDLIEKPFTSAVLRSRVAAVLGSRA